MAIGQTSWAECLGKIGATRATFFTDGGAWPTNPGHGAAGIATFSPDGRVVRLEWRYLGSQVTSNEAEYAAVFRALEVAKELGLLKVDLRTDSQLVAKQLAGEWQTRSAKFAGTRERYEKACEDFRGVTLEWVSREENTLADALVGIARQLDWGTAGRLGIDGRDELGAYLADLFERHGVRVRSYDGGYLKLEAVWVRPLPFYHTEGGRTYPSIERATFEEVCRGPKPVVLAWRPQGMRQGVLDEDEMGQLPRRADLARDMRVEPLFAFANDLRERKPGGRALYGYRGTRVLVLEGPWRTAQEFFWWRKIDV